MILPFSGHWKRGVGPGGGGVAAGLSGVGSPAEGCWRSGGGDAAAWPGGGASVSFLTGPPGGPLGGRHAADKAAAACCGRRSTGPRRRSAGRCCRPCPCSSRHRSARHWGRRRSRDIPWCLRGRHRARSNRRRARSTPPLRSACATSRPIARGSEGLFSWTEFTASGFAKESLLSPLQPCPSTGKAPVTRGTKRTGIRVSR